MTPLRDLMFYCNNDDHSESYSAYDAVAIKLCKGLDYSIKYLNSIMIYLLIIVFQFCE